jgi:hypothetical protein
MPRLRSDKGITGLHRTRLREHRIFFYKYMLPRWIFHSHCTGENEMRSPGCPSLRSVQFSIDRSTSNLQGLRVLYILFRQSVMRPEKVSGLRKGLTPNTVNSNSILRCVSPRKFRLISGEYKKTWNDANNAVTRGTLASRNSIERYIDYEILESRDERHSMNSRDAEETTDDNPP